jgi:AraC-like DNA-binding protein
MQRSDLSSWRRTATGGQDLEEARAFHEAGYNGRGFRLRSTELPFAYEYSLTGDRHVTLRKSVLHAHGRGTIAPESDYIASWLSAGEGAYDTSRADVAASRAPGMYPRGRSFDFVYKNVTQNLVHVSAEYLEKIAFETSDGGPTRVVFDHAKTPVRSDVALWGATLREIAPVILSQAASPLSRAESNRQLVRVMLRIFPSTVRPSSHRFDAVPSAVTRAATEFIEANAHRPITPSDVARAVAWSPRTLQEAFRRHHGYTPHQVIRDARLERARIELRVADPMSSTVAAIADRWGFAHHGRFSSTYAARFGELPSNTLASP